MELLRTEAIARIATDYYPDTFEAYIKITRTKPDILTNADHLYMITLARETQSLRFLPFAFYFIALQSTNLLGSKFRHGLSK